MPQVSVIAAGTGDSDVDELLHSTNFEKLLRRLSSDFDVILIDNPAHVAYGRCEDSGKSGQRRHPGLPARGRRRRDEAASARDLFDHDGAEVVGSILNAFDPDHGGQVPLLQVLTTAIKR